MLKRRLRGATKFYCLIPGNAMVGFPPLFLFTLFHVHTRIHSHHRLSPPLQIFFANNPFPPTLGKQWYFSSTSHGIGAKNLLKTKQGGGEEPQNSYILKYNFFILLLAVFKRRERKKPLLARFHKQKGVVVGTQHLFSRTNPAQTSCLKREKANNTFRFSEKL